MYWSTATLSSSGHFRVSKECRFNEIWNLNRSIIYFLWATNCSFEQINLTIVAEESVFPYTQDVNWTSYVRSICVLCLRGLYYVNYELRVQTDFKKWRYLIDFWNNQLNFTCWRGYFKRIYEYFPWVVYWSYYR